MRDVTKIISIEKSKGAKSKMKDKSVSRLRRVAVCCMVAGAALCVMTLAATSAQAAFGLNNFDVRFINADGSPATQAGSHPFAAITAFEVNGKPNSSGVTETEGDVKSVTVKLPTGFVGAPTATPRCSIADFIRINSEGNPIDCPNSTVIGTSETAIFTPFGTEGGVFHALYNLDPPPGTVAKFGFVILSTPVTVEVRTSDSPPYNVTATAENIPQTVPFFGSRVEVWGNPSDPIHDPFRGECIYPPTGESLGLCPTSAPDLPYLTLPRACTGPLSSSYEAVTWKPGISDAGSALTHDDAEPPQPRGMTGCGKLGFKPSITAQPTTKAAESPTGLDFSLNVNDEGLTNPAGLAQSDTKKAVVTLPLGMTANPSIAEGLNTCSEAELQRETVDSAPGAGCPEASKIGSVEVETPLVDEPVNGSLYVARQNENPFHSLLALYIVIRNPELGIIVKQAANVERNPKTGQLTTVVDDIPQLPFSHFRLHFREGARSPLSSPPLCGTYDVKAELTPWSGNEPLTTTSAFQIISGPNGGGCPSGNTPPFHPGLEAGTVNNAAGSYSPFNVRLSRNDGEQEFTHFSIKLPPGITGKLAGIPFCSDAAINAAKSRTGGEELASPSCPVASEVGRTLVGAGVGSALVYVPGKVYLAGPYNGSQLSIAAITSAKVGPFDVGTVVIREALKVNPETAEVFVDAAGSDPIPHIIDGIVVHARDIRVYISRPDFVLNPTNCERTSTASTVLGSGLDFASDSDDQPITVTSPFQAASCASLGFAPKLALSLKGGTKRGDTPKFKAVLTARKGDANIGEAQVTLPHSEFLEQAHIKTICTRVQFKEGTVPGEKCPAASVYGYAKAITPLLGEPLEGPVYLRSSSHNLPDLVAALNSGKINIALAGHIDSVKGGRIRNTFEAVPDAPVTKFTLEMQGGKKGLLVNSTNLCKSTNRAISHFTGQNGKVYDTKPVLKAPCKKAKKANKRGKAKARTSHLSRSAG
jgi:hypothetical protein